MDIAPVRRISPLDPIEVALEPGRARADELDPGQPSTTHGGQPRLELEGWPGGCLGALPGAGRDRR